MEGLYMRKLAVCISLALVILAALWAGLKASAAPAVLGKHCGDVGPLPLNDPEFCGCTWGEVYFQGQPVADATVTLTFGDRAVTGTTRSTLLEAHPYFDLTAHDLGARRGDLLTLTVTFGGEELTRSFRAWPEASGEQQVALTFALRGIWHPWITGGYTRSLALHDGLLWAGGPAGLISVNLTSGISVPQTLPWAEPGIRALAVSGTGNVWAVGAGGVAEHDGAEWRDHILPVSGTPRTVTVKTDIGEVWIGGGDSNGYVVVYTGTWQTAGTFPAAVTALTTDSAGRVWAGTWGAGVFRQNVGGDWTQFRENAGLASDWVLTAAVNRDTVWFGTAPYISGSGPRGGIARYDMLTDAWRVYTLTHGLPADSSLPQAPASVFALAVEPRGWVWAGVVDGVRILPEGTEWLTASYGLSQGAVRALIFDSAAAFAAGASGVARLPYDGVLEDPPVAHIESVTPDSLLPGETLNLRGWGSAEPGRRIVAWEWASDVDGALCTIEVCELPHALFTPGTHQLTFNVQDNFGMWGNPIGLEIEVLQEWRVFLPLVHDGGNPSAVRRRANSLDYPPDVGKSSVFAHFSHIWGWCQGSVTAEGLTPSCTRAPFQKFLGYNRGQTST